MTLEIPKEKWTEFFDDLTKRRFGWMTKIEVLDESIGDQILSETLPLSGLTFEAKSGKEEIELLVGENTEHQAHKIQNPVKVEYLDEGDFMGGVIGIEDENKTRTLIKLVNPMPLYLGYADYELVMASSR